MGARRRSHDRDAGRLHQLLQDGAAQEGPLNRHLAIALLLAAASLAAALASGAHRRAALVGAGASSAAAIGSLLLMRTAAGAKRPVQAALAVMALAFLARIVLVAGATALVVRAGESVAGFVVAFFVPYFLFAAVEGAYVHALGRASRPA